MKKFMSFVLAGAIAVSAGVGYANNAPKVSIVAEESSEPESGRLERTDGYITYDKYSDHVEITKIIPHSEFSDGTYPMIDFVIPAEIDGLPVTSVDRIDDMGCIVASLTIPNSVTFLGYVSCENIETIDIPESVTELDEHAFTMCKNLKTINIPKSVTEIGLCAFPEVWLEEKRKEDPLVIVNDILVDAVTCQGEVVIPDNVTKIADGAFLGDNDDITSIIFPLSVVEISAYNTLNFANLTSVTIENPNCHMSRVSFGEARKTATMYGYKGSTAQTYAEEHEMKFVAFDGEPPVTTEETKTLKGDSNGDNSVTIADAVAILQYLANPDEYPLDEQGAKNADVFGDDGINTEDALQIQKLDAGVIDKL